MTVPLFLTLSAARGTDAARPGLLAWTGPPVARVSREQAPLAAGGPV